MTTPSEFFKMEVTVPVVDGIGFTKTTFIDQATNNVFVVQQEANLTNVPATIDDLQSAALDLGYTVTNLPDL
jgi:hypothetical protein